MTEKQDVYSDLRVLAGTSVLCVGDIMLDRYVYGAIERISPEAPVPVLAVEQEKHMLGGAGNVAANLAALGVSAAVVAAVGADAAGADIAGQLAALGVRADLAPTPGRVTTVKTRFVGGLQQMLRVDREQTGALTPEVEAALLRRVEQDLPHVRAVILSDYGKGVLTGRIPAAVIAAARARGLPVVVDPKGRDFSRYRGATAITPNRKELDAAAGGAGETDDEIVRAAETLIESCALEMMLVTRSKDGLSLVRPPKAPRHVPACVREVYDVSGAGDTVIAVFAAGLAAGLSAERAAELANIAAGVVVGKSGTATARPEEIAAAADGAAAPLRKLASPDQAADQAERLRRRGQRVGFTNGCFDLLHPGHLSLLRQARAQCDFLIVAINSDASVRRLKGPSRPVQDQKARADILSALDVVDMVVVFDDDTPLALLRALRPDVLVKGGQYRLEDVVGHDVVAAYGGRVHRAAMEEGFSTTGTISRISG